MARKDNGEKFNNFKPQRGEGGRFLKGQGGRPKGATSKANRHLRKIAVDLFYEMYEQIPERIENLNDSEFVRVFLELAKLVIPKPKADDEQVTKEPIVINIEPIAPKDAD
jgi:hypothetical protein